jgi:hypothetical protein
MTSVVASTVIEPSQEVLDENRFRLVLELAARMRTFEEKYGFASMSLPVELGAGRVTETTDVANWLAAYRTLTALLGSGPAPVE